MSAEAAGARDLPPVEPSLARVEAVPGPGDPREFALQLALVAERLDERSARAVSRVETACAGLEQDVARAVRALADERERIVSAGRAAAGGRDRAVRLASAGLLAAALASVPAAWFAVESARREMGQLRQDRALLQAIDRSDLTLCGDGLCARLEGGEGSGAGGPYRPVARRIGR